MAALAIGLVLFTVPVHAGPTTQPASQPATRPSSGRPASAPASRPTWIKPSHLRILFQNQVGSFFKLVKLSVVLDGVYLYKRSDDSGVLDESKNLLVYDGAVAPVSHKVMVILVYQGTGLGLFTYQRQYYPRLMASRVVSATRPGGRTTVVIRAHKRGNLFWRLGNRLAVGFEVKEPGARRSFIPERPQGARTGAPRSEWERKRPTGKGRGAKKPEGRSRPAIR